MRLALATPTLERMFDRGREDRKRERRVETLVDKWDRLPQPMDLPGPLVRSTGRRREARPPVRVLAQIPVHYSYTEVIQAEGEVVEWTDRAVLVRAQIRPGTEPVHVWVWANAVTRLDPRPPHPGPTHEA